MLRLVLLFLLAFAIPAAADVWTFETPSENIQCSVGEDFEVLSDIHCTIIERSGPPAAHAFYMKEEGPAELLCETLDRNKDGFDRAEYGVTGEFGGFTCQSSRKGLECRNRDGHGFFLSRARQSIF